LNSTIAILSSHRAPKAGIRKGKVFVELLISAWVLVFTGGQALAEVPPEEAVGMFAATSPKQLNLSPLWGMVALKSGILRNIRFYGDYTSVPLERLPRHPGLPAAGNCPQDAIAAVIQYLFPSPDGINFVHNERSKDPIGQIALEQGPIPIRAAAV
jgi:hypothetical protein